MSLRNLAMAMAQESTNSAASAGADNVFQPNIVGGTVVPPSKFAYFAVTLGDVLCGGSLVHPQVLLTAGHCMEVFQDSPGVAIGVKELSVAGTVAFDAEDTSTSVSRQVVQGLRHPNYDDWSLDYDFALVKLNEPVTTIAPVQLNANAAVPADSQPITAMGFGLTSEYGLPPTDLHEVNVSVVNSVVCEELYADWNPVNDATMFCAGNYLVVDGDACQGDSGGPVITQDGVQVGIVSWADGCNREMSPGVYARVSGAKDFIEQGICALADNPPAYCNPTLI